MDVSNDVFQATAVQFLIDGQEQDAAITLLSCSLNVYETGNSGWVGAETHYEVHVTLSGPRATYDTLLDEQNGIARKIERALAAILPVGYYIGQFSYRAATIDIGPEWRDELLEIARGRGVHNQAVDSSTAFTWQTLRFRSASERRIAEALDKAGAFFVPNCLARLGPVGSRRTREPDFLVCDEGKWGILEVDGDPFHPPTTTAKDHARDRLFRAHGIRFIEHYDATTCYKEPDRVVREFLALLRQQP